MKRTGPLFALAGMAFCLWQARDLFTAWRHAPFDRFDPLAFGIWLLPLFWVAARERGALRVQPTLVLAAAGLTLLGSVCDLNVLQNLSLATVLGSFVVGELPLLPWLLAAVAWMPVFGWLGSGTGFLGVGAERLALAGAASAWAGWRLLSTTPRPLAA